MSPECFEVGTSLGLVYSKQIELSLLGEVKTEPSGPIQLFMHLIQDFSVPVMNLI